MRNSWMLPAVLAGAMLTPAPAFAAPADDGPVLGAAGVTLNGTAAVTSVDDQPVLVLTGGGYKQAGSAWASRQVDLRTSFDVEFTAHLRPAGGADGIALVVQADGPRALGGWGGGLGYRGIRNSVAVEFDTHRNPTDPSGNHVAVTLNGRPDTHVASAESARPLRGEPFRVRVRYDAGQSLEVYAGTDLLLRQPLDLVGTVGAEAAWVGFTGATGLVTAEQHVYDWSVTELG